MPSRNAQRDRAHPFAKGLPGSTHVRSGPSPDHQTIVGAAPGGLNLVGSNEVPVTSIRSGHVSGELRTYLGTSELSSRTFLPIPEAGSHARNNSNSSFDRLQQMAEQRNRGRAPWSSLMQRAADQEWYAVDDSISNPQRQPRQPPSPTCRSRHEIGSQVDATRLYGYAGLSERPRRNALTRPRSAPTLPPSGHGYIDFTGGWRPYNHSEDAYESANPEDSHLGRSDDARAQSPKSSAIAAVVQRVPSDRRRQRRPQSALARAVAGIKAAPSALVGLQEWARLWSGGAGQRVHQLVEYAHAARAGGWLAVLPIAVELQGPIVAVFSDDWVRSQLVETTVDDLVADVVGEIAPGGAPTSSTLQRTESADDLYHQRLARLSQVESKGEPEGRCCEAAALTGQLWLAVWCHLLPSPAPVAGGLAATCKGFARLARSPAADREWWQPFVRSQLPGMLAELPSRVARLPSWRTLACNWRLQHQLAAARLKLEADTASAIRATGVRGLVEQAGRSLQALTPGDWTACRAVGIQGQPPPPICQSVGDCLVAVLGSHQQQQASRAAAGLGRARRWAVFCSFAAGSRKVQPAGSGSKTQFASLVQGLVECLLAGPLSARPPASIPRAQSPTLGLSSTGPMSMRQLSEGWDLQLLLGATRADGFGVPAAKRAAANGRCPSMHRFTTAAACRRCSSQHGCGSGLTKPTASLLFPGRCSPAFVALATLVAALPYCLELAPALRPVEAMGALLHMEERQLAVQWKQATAAPGHDSLAAAAAWLGLELRSTVARRNRRQIIGRDFAALSVAAASGGSPAAVHTLRGLAGLLGEVGPPSTSSMIAIGHAEQTVDRLWQLCQVMVGTGPSGMPAEAIVPVAAALEEIEAVDLRLMQELLWPAGTNAPAASGNSNGPPAAHDRADDYRASRACWLVRCLAKASSAHPRTRSFTRPTHRHGLPLS